MMFFMIIFFIISVILESLVSNLIVNFIPFFIPCFIVIFASLKINRDHFYKTLIVAGIIYDLMYTNQVILNALLFCFYGQEIFFVNILYSIVLLLLLVLQAKTLALVTHALQTTNIVGQVFN